VMLPAKQNVKKKARNVTWQKARMQLRSRYYERNH
jgi:hypothetical protein